MKSKLIKIVHTSDLELNPELLPLTEPEREHRWGQLFGGMVGLIENLDRNGVDILIIAGDLVKGHAEVEITRAGYRRVYDGLKKLVEEKELKIFAVTGSHDTWAIEAQNDFPFPEFWESNQDGNGIWTLWKDPEGSDPISICDKQITIVGFGDLDSAQNAVNKPQYMAGIGAKSELLRGDQSFKIAITPTNTPGFTNWGRHTPFNYIASGGAEGDQIKKGRQVEYRKRWPDFAYSRQGRPVICQAWIGAGWEFKHNTITYIEVDTEKKIAKVQDLWTCEDQVWRIGDGVGNPVTIKNYDRGREWTESPIFNG